VFEGRRSSFGIRWLGAWFRAPLIAILLSSCAGGGDSHSEQKSAVLRTGTTGSRDSPSERLLPSQQAITTAPPSFDIKSATLQMIGPTEGRVEIEGQLLAEAGLANQAPLVLQVHDLASGVTNMIDWAALVAGDERLFSLRNFDGETGNFKIASEELSIDFSKEVLTLVGKDNLGQTCSWHLETEPDPNWEKASAEIGLARAGLMARTHAAVATYKDVISGLSFEAPFDEARVNLDTGYLDLFLKYLAARSADPTASDAHNLSLRFEADVEAYLTGANQSLRPGDQDYRETLLDAARWESLHTDEAWYETAVYQQVILPAPSAWQYRKKRMAYLEHTFIVADWTPGAGTTTIEEHEPNPWRGTLTLRIYQDIGTPPGAFHDEEHPWDPERLEPDTADPDSPGMLVEIEFLDHDNDNLIDAITSVGYQVDPWTGEKHEFTETDLSGHLITPLLSFLDSRYLI